MRQTELLDLEAIEAAIADELATPERDRCTHVAKLADLLAEAQRLRAELAVLRPIAKAVADALHSYRFYTTERGIEVKEVAVNLPQGEFEAARAWRD